MLYKHVECMILDFCPDTPKKQYNPKRRFLGYWHAANIDPESGLPQIDMTPDPYDGGAEGYRADIIAAISAGRSLPIT